MKFTCPHCSQNLELDSETLIALESASHFDCPTCGGAVEVPAPVLVPTKQATPGQTGKPAPERFARGTQQGINRNLLILGIVALLAIGGVAIFLASKNGGNIVNFFQNTTNQIINNTYFTQLIAEGVTTEKDLDSIAEIRPYGDGFIGVSKEAVDWDQAQDLAKRTGAQVLDVDRAAIDSQQDLLKQLATTFQFHLSTPTWIRDLGQPSVLASSEILTVKELEGVRRVLLRWEPSGEPSSGPATIECDLPLTPFEVGKQALSGKPSQWKLIPQEYQNRLFVKRPANDLTDLPFRVTRPGITTLIVEGATTKFEKEGWKIVATAKRTWGNSFIMEKHLEPGAYSLSSTSYFAVSLLIYKEANP